MNRADPGATGETRLYNPWTTPILQLGDWGIGVGIYFATLRFLAILMFLAGLLNTPRIRFYGSDEYRGGDDLEEGVPGGSAVCTLQQWRPCPTCDHRDFEDDRKLSVTLINTTTPTTTIFYLQNLCDGTTMKNGMIHFATWFFLMAGILVMRWHLTCQMEPKLDDDEQTAQDYSIVVTNPPHDARSPTEWKEFFESNFDCQVRAVTVASKYSSRR